ncbi:MAG: ParA family protein [Ardenticatenaceae bacterium]|nr:ParA family protein [Ardenticatenaceae bacterium]
MKTIVIANQKGGVGKTTTAVSLAHGLALRGHATLLVDLDPQGQCATFLGLQPESGIFDLLISRRPLADLTRSADTDGATRPGLRLLPGDKRTATAQIVLSAEGLPLEAFAQALRCAPVAYVVVDTSPSVGLLQESALYAADWLVAPVATDYPAAEGLAGVLATLSSVERRGGACQLLAVLPTMHDEVTRESKAALGQLHERFGDLVLPAIHRATILRECAAEATTIWEKAPTSRAAAEYTALVEKVLSHDPAS